MSEEEANKNEALKKELLERQIYDVVNEFESLKNLNLEYINTNERLHTEIDNLKELNEQQVLLNDTMMDSNKEIFKGSKRNIIWLVSILSLVAVIVSFQFIDKRINDKITGTINESIQKVNVNLKMTQESLASSKNLQIEISNNKNSTKKIQDLQKNQLKQSQLEFQEVLNNFKVNTVRTNEAINAIKKDYETALSNFKELLSQKDLETQRLKKALIKELAKSSIKSKELENLQKKYQEELIALQNSKKETLILTNKKKTIQTKKTPSKHTVKKTVKKKVEPISEYSLLQKAFKYQKKQQYTNAIKTYKEVLKLNPKKDIAYYNLGIIYGNQKKYDLAIKAYKKSIKLNPKRNLTFTNLYELQLITNKSFDENILKIYKDYHQNKKISLIKYEMIDIFKDVKYQKNIDKKLHNWQKNYDKISLGNWSFTMLKNWIKEEKDKTTKDNLTIVLKTFEAHK